MSDTLTIAELEHGEKLVLVGLVRLMIRLDGEFSEDEREFLDDLVTEIGEESFNALAAEVTEKMQDEEQVRYYAERTQRQIAQDLIYGTLFDLGAKGTIVSSESELLEWLRTTWKLEGRESQPYR